MSLIDREATFRGTIVDHGVSLTKNDWPQWVVRFKATEIWDDEDQVWVDWTDVDECEITGYMVLFGSTGVTLTAKQLVKAVGWNGISYTELNDLDLSNIIVQFRVEKRTHENKTTLQVNWIDKHDAEPGRSIKKLNTDELKSLDAKFKKFIGQTKTPVSATTTIDTTTPTVKAKGKKPTQLKSPVTNRKKGGPDPLGPPSTPQPKIPVMGDDITAEDDVTVGSCTKQEAWDDVVKKTERQRNNGVITDARLSEVWLNCVCKINKNPDKLTNEDWFNVRVEVLDELVGIPF